MSALPGPVIGLVIFELLTVPGVIFLDLGATLALGATVVIMVQVAYLFEKRLVGHGLAPRKVQLGDLLFYAAIPLMLYAATKIGGLAFAPFFVFALVLAWRRWSYDASDPRSNA